MWSPGSHGQKLQSTAFLVPTWGWWGYVLCSWGPHPVTLGPEVCWIKRRQISYHPDPLLALISENKGCVCSGSTLSNAMLQLVGEKPQNSFPRTQTRVRRPLNCSWFCPPLSLHHLSIVWESPLPCNFPWSFQSLSEVRQRWQWSYVSPPQIDNYLIDNF